MVRFWLFLGSILLLCSGCTFTTHQIGTHCDLKVADALKAGITTKEDVHEMLGMPSLVSPLDRSVWVYLSQTRDSFLFFSPVLKKGQGLALEFSPSGVLQNWEYWDQSKMADLSILNTETPLEYEIHPWEKRVLEGIKRIRPTPPLVPGNATGN